MDPDETLKEIRRLLSKDEYDNPMDDLETVSMLFGDFDEWLSKGGFKPADWDGTRNNLTGVYRH